MLPPLTVVQFARPHAPMRPPPLVHVRGLMLPPPPVGTVLKPHASTPPLVHLIHLGGLMLPPSPKYISEASCSHPAPPQYTLEAPSSHPSSRKVRRHGRPPSHEKCVATAVHQLAKSAPPRPSTSSRTARCHGRPPAREKCVATAVHQLTKNVQAFSVR